MTWEQAKATFDGTGAAFDEAKREVLLPRGARLSFAPAADSNAEVSHCDVVLAVRAAIVKAAEQASSAEDVEALARLMSAYNAAKDWFP